jgi:Double zinc ribbon
MENDPAQNPVPIPPTPASTTPPATMLCPQCHQPVTPTEYFCPNCGKKLNEPGLSTSITAQILLYGFSIGLPIIAFLAITKWQAIDYVKSPDPKAQQMGWIAIALLVISTFVTGWYAWIGIKNFLQSATSTAGLSSLGY